MRLAVLRPYVVLGLVYLAAGLLGNFTLAAIVVSLYLTYQLISRCLSRDIFDSAVFIILITPFFYALLLQCIALMAWVFNHNFPLLAAAPACVLFLLVLNALTTRSLKRMTTPSAKTKVRFAPAADLVAIMIATLIITCIAILPLITTKTMNPASILNSINGNVDDLAHIQLLNDRVQFDRGILFHTNISTTFRSSATYPSGWHSANAILVKAVNPGIEPGLDTVMAYVVTKFFWFFVLVYVFVRSAFVFAGKHERGPKAPLIRAVLLAILSLITVIAFLVDMFGSGFYSFFPQLTSLLLLMLVALQLKQPGDLPALEKTLPMAAILVISGSLTWLLLLPAVLLAGAVVVALYIKGSRLSQVLRRISGSIFAYLPLYILLGGALLVQYYVIAADKTSVSFLHAIVLPGGTPTYTNFVYLLIAIGVALCLARIVREARFALNSNLIIMACLLALASVFYGIQLHFTGQLAYYYFKVMTAVVVLAVPIAIAGFIWTIERISNDYMYSTMIVTGVFFSLLLLPQIAVGATIRYLSGHRDISPQTQQSVYAGLQATLATTYNQPSYTIYFIPGKAAESDFATMALKTNKPSSTCFDTARRVFNFTANPAEHTDDIRADCGGLDKLEVLTNQETISELKSTVAAASLEKIITVRLIGDDAK